MPEDAAHGCKTYLSAVGLGLLLSDALLRVHFTARLQLSIRNLLDALR